MTERAQSEVLGYVLVFSLIMLTVGTVYVMGFSELDQSRQAQQVTNMERGFDVLADNIQDVHRHGAPSRATELKLGGGTIGFGDGTSILVNATDTANTSRTRAYPMTTRPIVYRSGEGTQIAYSAGGVFRTDDGHDVLLSAPSWTLNDSGVVIPYVVTYPAGNATSLGGNSAILVTADRESRRSLQEPFESATGGDVEVDVTVDSPRVTAWQEYFEAEGFTPVDDDPTDGNVTYRLHTDVVYVPRTDIAVDLQR